MKKYIDLTQLFTSYMPVYPGDAPARLEHSVRLEDSGCNDHQLTTGMHVGTHMDGPLHMIAGGRKLCDFPPEKFFGRGVLVDCCRQTGELKADVLKSYDIRKNDIVLIMTGFSKYYGDEKKYFEQSPVFTLEFAQALVDKGVKIAGMDMSSPDKAPYDVHKLLLSHEVLILENLANLEGLFGIKNFEVIALPAKLDADSAPTRVIANYE